MTTIGFAQSMVDELGLRPAAFIDRDGVINEERNYVHRVDDFVILPGVPEALRRFRDAGYVLVVVTNQAGIGRGMYSEADFHELTRHMQARLAEYDASVDAVYFCPHHPTAGVGAYRTNCNCRKPHPGMLLDAQRDWPIDMTRSVLVGDKLSDVQAGLAAGVGRCVLVRSGHELGPDESAAGVPVYDDLLAAAVALTS